MALVADTGVGDEENAVVQIVPAVKTVFDVVCQTLGVFSAILFRNAHLAVLHLDAGLQVQKVRAKCGGGGAAAAPDQIVQPVHQETGLHPGGEVVQLPLQLVQRCGGFRQLAGFQHHQTLTGGQVPGVNHPDVFKILRGNAGMAVRRGKVRADADMHHAVIFARIFREMLLIFADADGGGGAEIAACGDVGENFGGGDGHAVNISRPGLDDRQGGDGDVVFFQNVSGKVAGAVSRDFDVHNSSPIGLLV